MICSKCGKELKKVLEVGSTAPKSFLKKEGYDGIEWVERYKQIKRFGFPYLPSPYWVFYRPEWNYPKTQFVRFSLCIKCTPKDFNFSGES